MERRKIMGEVFKYEFSKNDSVAKCFLLVENIRICECEISIEKEEWTIRSWYTKEGYGNSGYGSKCLKALANEIFTRIGTPCEIFYIWNGANNYVFEWMEKHFGAVSMCPIAVQKNCADDDWESHIYRLDRDKFLIYCGLAV